jgi:gluconolactonase
MAQVQSAESAQVILDHDPYVVLDPRFAGVPVAGGRVERLWTGGTWCEGPAWFAAGHLLWSEIPSNRILRWDEATGAVSVFRQPSGGANGNTVDRAGRLVTCEGSTRRVTRAHADGRVTVLADRTHGRRFNSPNDVVEKSDGTIWFTDPTYGGPDYDGVPEMGGCHVWRLDPATGDMRQMTDDMVMPNGLAFSLDESLLYVIDTGSTEVPQHPNHIRRFSVTPNGLRGGEVLATSAAQKFDGLRLDRDGNLWCAEGDGVHVLAPDGTMIGRIVLPERAANLTFGGRDGGWLLMTATTSLYRVPVGARAAQTVR